MPQLVSVLEVHALVHHGIAVMQVAGAVQSELVAQVSPVGVEPTPPSAPGIAEQYDGVGEEDDTGLQVAFLYCEQSASVEQLGTHALPEAVTMQRFGWLTLFAPHPALDTHGWVQKVPWHVLPLGQSAVVAHGSPTCEVLPAPPLLLAPLLAPLLLVVPLLPPPLLLLVLPLLDPVVPSPPLDPSSDVLSVPTA